MSTAPAAEGPGPGALAFARSWTTSPALDLLVASFGGDLGDAPTPLADRLAWLDAFSDRWDTRMGRERNQADELELTQVQVGLVLDAADELGLRTVARPARGSYDHLLVLGGLVRACVTRPAYAAYLMDSLGVRFGRITALGGHRRFGGDEPMLASLAGVPDVFEEYDALDVGMRRAFALGEPVDQWGESSDLVGGTWGVRRYAARDRTRVDVAAAPSSDPVHRRANTPDTYEWFARELATLRPGESVLAVTTPIYVPAQQGAALRMLGLPFGAHVETIGNDPALVPVELRQEFTPTKYLLEVRSAIRSIRSLVTDLDRAGRARPATTERPGWR